MIQKYFLAIVPPEPILTEIQNIKEYISKNYNSHGALQSPAHITVHLPFNWEEEKEEKLLDCLTNFSFENTINITLNGFSSFEPRVVFINVENDETLFLLQQKLVFHVKKNLSIFNQSDNLRGFHAHITIAFRDLKKQTFYKVWDEFKAKEFKAEFNCNEFALLKKGKLNWEIYKRFKFTP
jgi:2'-5' RNA ligase